MVERIASVQADRRKYETYVQDNVGEMLHVTMKETGQIQIQFERKRLLLDSRTAEAICQVLHGSRTNP